MQYSVFVIDNSARILRNIITEINANYKKQFEDTDSIVIFHVCKSCEGKIVRYGSARHELEDVVCFS